MLEKLANQVLQRNDATNATTYATHNATMQLFGRDNATDYATGVQPTPLKALSQAILNATDHATSVQLEAENNATFYATFHATDHATLGKTRLRVAARGLPLDFAELQVFFSEDLQDFGNGAVSMAGIRKAAEWFAYTYPAWRAAQ